MPNLGKLVTASNICAKVRHFRGPHKLGNGQDHHVVEHVELGCAGGLVYVPGTFK